MLRMAESAFASFFTVIYIPGVADNHLIRPMNRDTYWSVIWYKIIFEMYFKKYFLSILLF